MPSDTRSKLAAIKKKCAALRDAEKDAAQHLDEDAETEDDARAADELYKTAEDLNVFEWARIDKGDDDLALETLVATPLAQSKSDAFQATATFVRGIASVVARRKESATLLPGAMEYLLDKVRTKPNKHTGCKMCPVLCGNQAVRWVPSWLGRAARNRHRHAIEQAAASMAWRTTGRFSTNAP